MPGQTVNEQNILKQNDKKSMNVHVYLSEFIELSESHAIINDLDVILYHFMLQIIYFLN